MNHLTKILQTNRSVFSFQDIKQITQIATDAGVKSFLQRSKDGGSLLNPIKWWRTLPHYDPFVLACAMRLWSYISCETVLFREGVFFQFYGNTVSCIASQPSHHAIGTESIVYYRIKPSIFTSTQGIREHHGYRIATPERALCDYIYLNPRGVIDAPESINRIRIKQLLPLYPKKTALYITKLLDA